MVGIILVTHGRIGEEIFDVGRKTYGELKQVSFVSVLPEDGRPIVLEKLKQAIDSVNTGEGILFLTDGFGGSPTNLCMAVFKDYPCEILTGLNLPMFLDAVCNQEKLSLKELAEKSEAGAKKGILQAGEMIRQRTQSKPTGS